MLAVFKIRRGKMPIWHYIMVTIIDVHMYIIYIFFFTLFFHWNDLEVFVNAHHKWVVERSRDLFISVYITIHARYNTLLLPHPRGDAMCGLHSRQWSGTYSWKSDDGIGRQHGKSVIAYRNTHIFPHVAMYRTRDRVRRSQRRVHFATLAPLSGTIILFYVRTTSARVDGMSCW